MKNLLRANGIMMLAGGTEKIRCHVNTPDSQKKLFRRYGKAAPHQRKELAKQQRFYHALHGKAMDVVWAKMRNENDERKNGAEPAGNAKRKGNAEWNDHFERMGNAGQNCGSWSEFFTDPRIDDTGKYNGVNCKFLGHISKFMKKPMVTDIFAVRRKMWAIALKMKDGSIPASAEKTFNQLMQLSIRVKHWLLEDKITLYYKEVDGKKILGFDFVNHDGSKGGFVNAKCHFHGAGRIWISEKSLVLGEAVFAGNVTLRCSTIHSGRFEDVDAYASVFSTIDAHACKFDHVICHEVYLTDSNFDHCTVKRSTLARCSGDNSVILDTKDHDKKFRDVTREWNQVSARPPRKLFRSLQGRPPQAASCHSQAHGNPSLPASQ